MFNCDIASVDLTPLPILPSEVATDSSPLSAKNVTDKNLLGIPEWLAQINDDISRSLERGTNIRQLVAARACAIDSLLIALFKWFELDKTDLAFFLRLVATGAVNYRSTQTSIFCSWLLVK